MFRASLLAFLFFAVAAAAQPVPQGGVVGVVSDAASGEPLAGATVELASEGDPGRPGETRTTDAAGSFEFSSVTPGRYEVRVALEGYRAASRADLAVAAGAPTRADLALAPEPSGAAAEPELPSDVEEFLVVASPVAEILAASRMDADQLLDTLSADDFSKLAASDVADALKFVPGVNVVEGQFAVIRGLEDRYSSTLFNGAPVPSPDPDRQSVQLDLFPSDVVSDLAVAKTFGQGLPSNSSAGSINILTGSYPEELEFKLSGATGWNDNAWSDFLDFEDGSAVGHEIDGFDTLERDFGASLGGRGSWLEREIRFKAAAAWEKDYETSTGYQESLEPVSPVIRGGMPVESGGLALGELGLTGGRFDLTESTSDEQLTGFTGFGMDLDQSGNHKLDLTLFYTHKTTDTVLALDDGYLPGFDYEALAVKTANGEEIDRNADYACCATLTSWIARSVRGSANDPASRGPLWFTNFASSESFDSERDLFLSQLNGDHRFDALEGLHVSWATNYAKTTQDETSRGLRYFFEPDDPNQAPVDFPAKPFDLGPGRWAANNGIFQNSNDVTEDQGFGRLDAEYEIPLADEVTLELSAGAWYEDSKRDVTSSFLLNPTVGGLGQFAIFGDTPEELGKEVYDAINLPNGVIETDSEARREIEAWHAGTKTTLYEDFDLLAGVRLESIFIESLNDAFTGELALDGSPAIFPTKYLFFDRLDNPARNEVLNPPPPGTTFNDQIVGIDVVVDPTTGFVDLVDRAAIERFVNGRIDESKVLPAVGFTYRAFEGFTLRGAWSETVARPSFREMGFYVSVEPASDDLIVGNPQLGLSDVQSWDLRGEYVYGDGDLAALSLFYKQIQDPIESLVIRDPLNFDGTSSALYRTFFNNENEADLRGIELEARKRLDFLGVEELDYLSLGGNFTYIDAEVDRSEIEIARAQNFFAAAPGDPQRFSALESSRRLFGQPEWIANTDITFDHPDWGTKASLVLFGISDVLDAAGSTVISPDGSVISFTPDRYIDSFYQLDLIVSQTWALEQLGGDLTMRFSIKNLTDSTRRIVYDTDQTRNEFAERSFKPGRDYKLTFTYSF